jgi:hypothetical protein
VEVQPLEARPTQARGEARAREEVQVRLARAAQQGRGERVQRPLQPLERPGQQHLDDDEPPGRHESLREPREGRRHACLVGQVLQQELHEHDVGAGRNLEVVEIPEDEAHVRRGRRLVRDDVDTEQAVEPVVS